MLPENRAEFALILVASSVSKLCSGLQGSAFIDATGKSKQIKIIRSFHGSILFKQHLSYTVIYLKHLKSQ